MNGFWQRPPRWVWLLLAVALGILTASMLTLREGLRFSSRPLTGPETNLVVTALNLWEKVQPQPHLQAPVRVLLRQGRLRAMDEQTFQREAERSTLGYTDEDGRILLNPRICFAAWHCLGKLHPSDVVRTTSTLVHEAQHYVLEAEEEQALLAELRFSRAAWLQAEDPEWQREWKLWEFQLLERIAPPRAGPALLQPPRRESRPRAGSPAP